MQTLLIVDGSSETKMLKCQSYCEYRGNVIDLGHTWTNYSNLPNSKKEKYWDKVEPSSSARTKYWFCRRCGCFVLKPGEVYPGEVSKTQFSEPLLWATKARTIIDEDYGLK